MVSGSTGLGGSPSPYLLLVAGKWSEPLGCVNTLITILSNSGLIRKATLRVPRLSDKGRQIALRISVGAHGWLKLLKRESGCSSSQQRCSASTNVLFPYVRKQGTTRGGSKVLAVWVAGIKDSKKLPCGSCNECILASVCSPSANALCTGRIIQLSPWHSAKKCKDWLISEEWFVEEKHSSNNSNCLVSVK